MPGARSREMDALALLDEGGVVQVGERAVVFGHALYEGAVLMREAGVSSVEGPRRVVAREVLALAPVADEREEDLLARVDQALVELVRYATLTPASFQQARALFAS